MSFRADTRADAVGILRFFAALALGAPLAFFALKVTDPILERSEAAAAGTDAANTSMWLGAFGEYLVVIFLLISFFGLVALSLYQRRVVQ